MQEELTANLKASKTLNLQCDGWSHIRNEGIINFIITKQEPVFIDFIITKENRHTAEYIKSQIENVIEKYGPEKFFMLVGDNAPNMQKSFALISEKYKHISYLGCICHTLNLL